MGNCTSNLLDKVPRIRHRRTVNTTLPNKDISTSGLFITGLAGQYPENVYKAADFEHVVKSLCASHIETPGIQRLLAINQRSAILERASVYPVATLSDATLDPSAVDELSRVFRIVGVDITVSACEKALLEAQVSPNEITHTVGVTCTDAGNPGYDHFVSQRLKLRPDVDRVLLHGVGCAGGLSALRVAAGLAAGATQRKRAARILIFACELCSLHLRCDLAHISRNDGEASIAHALFGDAAAAMVLCNDLGRTTQVRSIYELLDWTNMVLPGTSEHMSFLMDPLGFRITLTKEVPGYVVPALKPLFERLQSSFTDKGAKNKIKGPAASDCDWALHPGGTAIIKGAEAALQLHEDQLRATREIYRTRGNSSSPSVFLVLDKLRHLGRGRDKVVAASFGPGLAIEMATMRRCR